MNNIPTAGTADEVRASSARTSGQTPEQTPEQMPEQASRRRTMIVPIKPPVITNFRPGHTEGDSDFDGHGPFVHIVTQVQRNGSILVLNTSAFFQIYNGKSLTLKRLTLQRGVFSAARRREA